MSWKEKLKSRKFWAAVAGFAAPLILTFGGSAETAERVTALILSGAALIGYVFVEGRIDAGRNGTTNEAGIDVGFSE